MCTGKELSLFLDGRFHRAKQVNIRSMLFKSSSHQAGNCLLSSSFKAHGSLSHAISKQFV